jgi:hypothetical protein
VERPATQKMFDIAERNPTTFLYLIAAITVETNPIAFLCPHHHGFGVDTVLNVKG